MKNSFVPPTDQVSAFELMAMRSKENQIFNNFALSFDNQVQLPPQILDLFHNNYHPSSHTWSMNAQHLDGSDFYIIFDQNETFIWTPSKNSIDFIENILVKSGQAVIIQNGISQILCSIIPDGKISFTDLNQESSPLKSAVYNGKFNEKLPRSLLVLKNQYILIFFEGGEVQIINLDDISISVSDSNISSLTFIETPISKITRYNFFRSPSIYDIHIATISDTDPDFLFGATNSHFVVIRISDFKTVKTISIPNNIPISIASYADSAHILTSSYLINITNIFSKHPSVRIAGFTNTADIPLECYHILPTNTSICFITGKWNASFYVFRDDSSVFITTLLLSNAFNDFTIGGSSSENKVSFLLSQSGLFTYNVKSPSEFLFQPNFRNQQIDVAYNQWKQNSSSNQTFISRITNIFQSRNLYDFLSENLLCYGDLICNSKLDIASKYEEYKTYCKFIEGNKTKLSMVPFADRLVRLLVSSLLFKDDDDHSENLSVLLEGSTASEIMLCYEKIKELPYDCKTFLGSSDFQMALLRSFNETKDPEILRVKLSTSPNVLLDSDTLLHFMDSDIETAEKLAYEFKVSPVLAEYLHRTQNYQKITMYPLSVFDDLANLNYPADILGASAFSTNSYDIALKALETIGKKDEIPKFSKGLLQILSNNYSDAAESLICYQPGLAKLCAFSSGNVKAMEEASNVLMVEKLNQLVFGDGLKHSGKELAIKLLDNDNFPAALSSYVVTRRERNEKEDSLLFASILTKMFGSIKQDDVLALLRESKACDEIPDSLEEALAEITGDSKTQITIMKAVKSIHTEMTKVLG